jgi:S-adenosylmethionine decarboxylase proenzyme
LSPPARAPWRCAGGLSGETIAAIARNPFEAEEPFILVGREGADPAAIIAPMRGLHLTADLRGCAAARPVMTTPAVLRSTCLEAVAAAGLSAVGELFHRFTPAPSHASGAPAGITGVVLLAESHLAVHTWPEIEAATLDVYVCNLGADNSARAEALLTALIAAFAPASVERHAIERGSAPATTAR